MAKKPVESRKHTTITIPVTLFELLEEKIKTTGFGSVSAYATYILRETLTRMMEDEIKKGKGKKNEDVILQKLRKLGYI
ncbi:MAG: CopG family transcriptional regulator [Candidatus Micrarchaeales archaeon]